MLDRARVFLPLAFVSSLRVVARAALIAGTLAPASAVFAAETVTIGNLVFVNKALVGVGRVPSDLRDKFGETFGSGSGIAVDPRSWVKTPTGYQGTLYMLPDRGYNIGGDYHYKRLLLLDWPAGTVEEHVFGDPSPH